MPKVLISGMEFDDKQAEAIVESTTRLAKAFEKVAKAFDGVKDELGRIGKENALFFAEMMRATHIAESFAETGPAITPQQEQELRASFPDRKIQAIKTVREITHMGLKEAKDLVDKYIWVGTGGADALLAAIRKMPAPPEPLTFP